MTRNDAVGARSTATIKTGEIGLFHLIKLGKPPAKPGDSQGFDRSGFHYHSAMTPFCSLQFEATTILTQGGIRNGADTLSGAETMKDKGGDDWLDFKAIKGEC